jgi:hypothetical protein
LLGEIVSKVGVLVGEKVALVGALVTTGIVGGKVGAGLVGVFVGENVSPTFVGPTDGADVIAVGVIVGLADFNDGDFVGDDVGLTKVGARVGESVPEVGLVEGEKEPPVLVGPTVGE